MPPHVSHTFHFDNLTVNFPVFWYLQDMKIHSVEIIDQRIARLKALIRRLRAERKVAFFAEQHSEMKIRDKSNKCGKKEGCDTA